MNIKKLQIKLDLAFNALFCFDLYFFIEERLQFSNNKQIQNSLREYLISTYYKKNNISFRLQNSEIIREMISEFFLEYIFLKQSTIYEEYFFINKKPEKFNKDIKISNLLKNKIEYFFHLFFQTYFFRKDISAKFSKKSLLNDLKNKSKINILQTTDHDAIKNLLSLNDLVNIL